MRDLSPGSGQLGVPSTTGEGIGEHVGGFFECLPGLAIAFRGGSYHETRHVQCAPPRVVPVHRLDPNSPSIARIYDYLLGGRDNFAADRALGEKLVELSPSVVERVIGNRQFLARAARWAVRQGVRDFIDLGCGLPTEPNTHGAVRAVAEDARVAYVDNDPVVLVHLRALAAHGNDGVTVVGRDARDVTVVVEAVSAAVRLNEPTCLIMGCLLNYFNPGEARALVASYAAALAPGSYIAVSVGRGDGPAADTSFSIYSDVAGPVYNHSVAEIASFFGPLDLVSPGLVEARQWRPDRPETEPLTSGDGEVVVGMAQVTR
jgi:O-methyltransferase involved in polyketide biosynthesis